MDNSTYQDTYRTYKRRILKGLASLLLVFCVMVTIAIAVIYLMFPRELTDFAQVLFLVKRDFREPIGVGRMLDGATAGLAQSANDLYTYYLTPDRNKMISMSTQGLTGAIGITVNGVKEREDRLIIREVRPDSGAARAGLRVDDAILRIYDRLVSDLTVDEAVALIRGEPDTYVLLLIEREGEEQKEYKVNRVSTIPVQTVQSGFLLDDYAPGYRIGYIFIDYFARNTGGMFDEHLDALLEDGAQGLVIDLRFNGGGDVAATQQVAGRLLPEGTLMKLVSREGEDEFRVRNGNLVEIPYIILVNGASASASEILAGAIQDRRGGLLVGVKTYGKGSVQSLYTLITGSGLRVTEGRYYLPAGKSIDGVGITPDIVVENNPEDKKDAQTREAVRLLIQIIDGTETYDSILEKAS